MAHTPENFAGYPMSVSEKRARSHENAKKWTPRDAIISMLRRIDQGEIKPDAVVICVRQQVGSDDDQDGTRTYFSNAAPDLHTSLGMLEHVKFRLLHEGGN